MRAWIFQLVLMWVWMVAVHDHHVMAANNDKITYANPQSTIRMYTSDEGGLTKSNILPFFIVGIDGLCVEANRNVPKLAKCNNSEIKQKWLLYGDGTIRTARDNSICIVTNDLALGSNILILPCDNSSSDLKSWQINTSENTIRNPGSKLYMDVTGLIAAPGTPLQFIIWPLHNDPNIRWTIKVNV